MFESNVLPKPPASAIVGTTSMEIVPANSRRLGLVITVTTLGRAVSLSLNGETDPAVLYSGITLFERGTYVMDEFLFSYHAVCAIASAPGTNIAIQEFELDEM